MILDEIAASARRRVAGAKAARPLESLREAALAKAGAPGAGEGAGKDGSGGPDFPFEKALSRPGLSFICEVKKASPSKGVIAADFPWLEIAREYEAAGAEAVSVLTEPEYFMGRDAYLADIAAALDLPVLRKDFIIDSYQIYEAKLLGAAAVLLICALLDRNTLVDFIALGTALGLSCLVEVHTPEEILSALDAGARIIGINNRDLKTFTVDTGLTGRLRKLIPPGVITVSESGIRSPEDIRFLAERQIDGVLIGETLMRAADKKAELARLKAAGRLL
ncbi:MAG: indole-3-glycerol phosphate synthase TrpC [Spirochaetaceae bacterium]|jgi:indole-3-glycerol phosphate synthase|nr:indole-3-glycerol phosphate synthase TrpC [Spirochaetaceae bacterium]